MLTLNRVLSVFVIWEPHFASGAEIARRLFNHYTRTAVTEAGGGVGVAVSYRSDPGTGGGDLPDPIPISATSCTAIIVLVETNMIHRSNVWIPYLDGLSTAVDEAPNRNRIIPVAIDESAYDLGGRVSESNLNFIRWKDWEPESLDRRMPKLVTRVTDALCRLLRSDLALGSAADRRGPLEGDALENFRLFLSHAKRDGVNQAKAFRTYLADESGLDTFFDAHEIPAGMNFIAVIRHHIGKCAVVVFHTDLFSSRPVCQLEVLEAKRRRVPMIVVNLLVEGEERGFPYLGNTSVIRLDLNDSTAFDKLTSSVLDELLKDLYWRASIARLPATCTEHCLFLSRPPEIAALVDHIRFLRTDAGDERVSILIHPDPPLSTAESDLLGQVFPDVAVESFKSWSAKNPVP